MNPDHRVPRILGNCNLFLFVLVASILASSSNQNNKKPSPAPSNAPASGNNSAHSQPTSRPAVSTTNTRMTPSPIKPGSNAAKGVPTSTHATTTTTLPGNRVTAESSHRPTGVVNTGLKTPIPPNSRVINFQHYGQKVQATLVGGKIRSIQAGKMSIQRTLGGQRRIESVDSAGRQTVSTGTNQGYVLFGGVSRTANTTGYREAGDAMSGQGSSASSAQCCRDSG